MLREKIHKAAEAFGNRYALCRLLSQRGKQIHQRFYRESCRFAPSLERAVDELITGKLQYELPQPVAQVADPLTSRAESLASVISVRLPR
jgi:DNA-directed RNA polymerase subunit K/omega